MAKTGLPSMAQLGIDLRRTTLRQRWTPILMPWLWAAGFVLLWDTPWRWGCGLCLVMVFSACSTSAHDVVHGSLGLSKAATERLLFLLGAPILESGHAYRLTHLEHHRIFPDEADVEGEAAHLPLWKVLLSGPVFLPRLWLWAWRKSEKSPTVRRWLALEAFLPFMGLALGLLNHGIFAYAIAVLVSSWFYPTFAVWLPHRHFEPEPTRHSLTCRGRLIPRMFLPLAYHLEHHLYPAVPSHNLPELARRLEPALRERGVGFVRVP
jgi:beta-carotene hydroxylase